LSDRPIQPRYRPTPPPCRTPPGRHRHPPPSRETRPRAAVVNRHWSACAGGPDGLLRAG
jgi:hypothetical protein